MKLFTLLFTITLIVPCLGQSTLSGKVTLAGHATLHVPSVWDTLIHYYAMEEVGTSRTDSRGSANMSGNSISASTTPGIHNLAADFTGVDDGDNLHTGTIPLTLPCSIGFWIYQISGGFSGDVLYFTNLCYVTAGDDPGCSGPFSFAISIGATTVEGTMSIDAKHFITLTYNVDGTLTIYVDGAFIDTISGAAGGSDILRLGTSLGPKASTVYIDELSVFSSELTAAQVTELYNSNAGKFYP